MFNEFPIYTSPTLLAINEQDMPNPPPASAACRHCPGAVWMLTTDGVRCYCRVMHLMTWSPEEMSPPSKCDGQLISVAEMERKSEAEQ